MAREAEKMDEQRWLVSLTWSTPWPLVSVVGMSAYLRDSHLSFLKEKVPEGVSQHRGFKRSFSI